MPQALKVIFPKTNNHIVVCILLEVLVLVWMLVNWVTNIHEYEDDEQVYVPFHDPPHSLGLFRLLQVPP